MIVCSCRVVTDRTVRAAMAAGASCIDSIGDKCSAGTGCGGCWPELERLLVAHAPTVTSQHDAA